MNIILLVIINEKMKKMLKIAKDIEKVAEVIESKFSKKDLKKAEKHLRKKALEKKIPYITFLRLVSQEEDLSAITRLLSLYLLYVY